MPYKQGSVVTNDKGERLQLVGAEWQPIASVEQQRMQEQAQTTAKEMGSLGAFGAGIARAAGSGYWGAGASGVSPEQFAADQAAMQEQSPWASGAGMAAGALPGIIAAGASLPAQVVGGAAMGALGDSTNTGASAALGAAAGAIPFGLGAAFRAAPRALEAAKSVTEAFPVPGLPVSSVAAARAGGTMSDRVLSKIEAFGPQEAGSGKYYPGLNTSQELIDQGFTVMPSRQLALDATKMEQAQIAKKVAWVEGLRGAGEEAAQQNRNVFSRALKNEMGVTEDVALTPKVVGDVLSKEGARIGEILTARGNMEVPLSTLKNIGTVVAEADTGFQNALKGVLTNIENDIARNGQLTPAAYQQAITKLNNIGAPGGAPGKALAAKQIRDELSGIVEGNLSAAEKVDLTAARYRYKIAKTLNEGASTGTDFAANVRSFGNRWDKKTRERFRGQDKIGKLADTVAFIDRMETTPGTTLQRIMADAPVKAPRAAMGLGGLGGGSYLLDKLTGD